MSGDVCLRRIWVLVPTGPPENSPAFQRRERFGVAKVPEGRLNVAMAWQDEYGAFSVSVSQLDKTMAYIRGQPEHHRKMSFQEELLALLKKHHIEYDERYLWK